MIKHFCDLCGVEMTPPAKPPRAGYSTPRASLMVEVTPTVKVAGKAGPGVACRACLVRALNLFALDERPTAWVNYQDRA